MPDRGVHALHQDVPQQIRTRATPLGTPPLTAPLAAGWALCADSCACAADLAPVLTPRTMLRHGWRRAGRLAPPGGRAFGSLSRGAPRWPTTSVAHQQPSRSERDALTATLSAKLGEADERSRTGSAVKGVGVAWVTGAESAAASKSQSVHDQTKDQLRPLGDGVGLRQAAEELVAAQQAGTQDSNGGYLAYAPTGAVFGSALASFASAATNP